MEIENIIRESKSSLYKKYINKHNYFYEKNAAFEFFSIFAVLTFFAVSITTLCVFNTPSANKKDFMPLFIVNILLFLFLAKGVIFYVLEKKYEKLYKKYDY